MKCYRCTSWPCTCSDGITLIHGDCGEVVPSLRIRCDAIVMDPPYAIPTVVAQGRAVTRNVGDLSMIERGLIGFFNEFDKALEAHGRCFVFCDGTSYSPVFRSLYSRMTLALLIWDKGRIGMGREFRKSHELIVHGWLDETPLFSDGVGRPDVLKFSPVGDERLHPAQKPVDLVCELLRVCGQVVLDPFCGSGTTLVAAKQLNRRAIGIEIEERYCEIAANRLRQSVLQFQD